MWNVVLWNALRFIPILTDMAKILLEGDIHFFKVR